MHATTDPPLNGAVVRDQAPRAFGLALTVSAPRLPAGLDPGRSASADLLHQVAGTGLDDGVALPVWRVA